MTNPLRIFGSKIFWSIYEPMSSEFWVKLTGNKKIKEIKEALKLFCERPSTLEIGAAEGYITRCL
ncbi:MAG: hypothetical protein KJ574_00345, partial [Nanoarchaeota archaeon]|nr:hypothetical protein [Nanoarchaeota archaeon]